MLQIIFIYIIKVIVCSGIFTVYYYAALRNKLFHYYNRFYILMSVALSALLPLLHLQWFTFRNASPQTIHLFKIVYGSGEPDVIVSSNYFLSWQQCVLYSLLLMSFCLLIFLCIRIAKIQRLKKKYPVQQLQEFDFVQTDIKQAPFSFLKNIFWRNDISLNDETGRQILQHEITHVKQKHSWDKLFMQLMLCFYWMNPFYYLLKKELYLIHEFIADEKAANKNDAAAFAKMLLASQYGNFAFLPAQSIFHSPIKRRLFMLTTSKKPQFSYARRLMILPLLTITLCLFAFSLKNENAASSAKKIMADKPFVLVVDAGHGGKDYGAVGNGLYEKDVALKIAEKIKDLSSEYGINVVLTRSSDVFMSPQEKSDFANAQNADAFLCVHVNSAPNNQPSKSGFEIGISRKNLTFLNNNQALGSAILQSISKNFETENALEQQRIGIWVLDNSNIPSALIECGFITNTNDANNLKDDSKIELMAKNILQGVAMYANNKVDKSKLLQLKNGDTSVPQSKAKLNAQTALYVVNNKIVSKSEVDKIDPSFIQQINVLKDKTATDKYGDKGKNGVVEITLKPKVISFSPPVIVNDSDSTANASNDVNAKLIFTEAQQHPQFPGGVNGWKTYLENNLRADVPAKNKAPKGIYTVTVSFLVDENGKVSEVRALNNPGFETATEAVRVIAQGPRWIPAVQNGHKVIFMEKQNISFSTE